MDLRCKCNKCENLTLMPNFELTMEKFKEEYLGSIRTMFPFTEPPLHPGYLILACETEDCPFSERVTLEDFTERIRDDWSYAAWAKARQQLDAPENFEQYFEKYIFKSGKHLEITKEDRERNPFVDKLLKHVEEKHSKNSKS